MLIVTYKPFMLSGVLLNVVMLSVVMPSVEATFSKAYLHNQVPML
jgi:hypothetical protein